MYSITASTVNSLDTGSIPNMVLGHFIYMTCVARSIPEIEHPSPEFEHPRQVQATRSGF